MAFLQSTHRLSHRGKIPISRFSIKGKLISVADPGDGKGAMPPPPLACKNSHKQDGCQAQRLICHVSCPPLSEVSGSAAESEPSGPSVASASKSFFGELKLFGIT